MKRNQARVPLLILLIGIIISGGIIFSRFERKEVEIEAFAPEEIILDIQPIGPTDHILGSPNAKLLIIEYSDLECPFCQQFHPTMKRIMRDYGPTGQVAWVYRHFPITDIFENSYRAAVASECVVNLDETENRLIFWEYIDKIFANIPVQLNTETLIRQAVELEIDEGDFRTCLMAERYTEKIERDMNDVAQILKFDSGFSTPYSLIFSRNGLEERISGAVSYAELKLIIDNILERQN